MKRTSSRPKSPRPEKTKRRPAGAKRTATGGSQQLPPTVRIRRVASRGAPLPLPRYQTPGAAGADLQADLERTLTIAPGQRVLVPTGLALELPIGFEGQIRPRSGLAMRSGVGIPNAPGTIDSDYRGEIQVALINWGTEPVTIERGDRVAQLVIAPVVQGAFELVEELGQTARGAGGFGSTGK